MNRADCLEYLASRVDEHWLVTTSLSVNTALWSRLRPGKANFMGLNMGLCTPFALGLSLAFPRQKVIALDSDGSLMVDTSALITVADAKPENLVVMVFDNESYARMGPTPTSRGVDLEKMAQGAGICRTFGACTLEDFKAATDAALVAPGPVFLLAKVEPERTRIHGTRETYGQAMVQAFKSALDRHPDYIRRQSTVEGGESDLSPRRPTLDARLSTGDPSE
jgi:thiamine pyrophosphate-dependent acetolactate synthase large subunit-like protein